MKDFIKCQKCGMLVNKNTTDHGIIISYNPKKFNFCDGLNKYCKICNKLIKGTVCKDCSTSGKSY